MRETFPAVVLPGRKSPLGPSRIACSCFLLAACQDASAPLPYSLNAGVVDSGQISPFIEPSWKLAPEPYRTIFDPAKGRPVQVFADQAVGGRVADFVAYHRVNARETRYLYFYPTAATGPGPGLCRSKVYLANGRREGNVESPGIRGNWQPDVYAVAGSVAPLPRPWPTGYADRLRASCAARRDMGFWYDAPPDKAYVSARLADAIVASARRPGPLPFELACRPYGPGVSGKPRCANDVRKTVASIDPRAILSAGKCLRAPNPNCLVLQMAKSGARSSVMGGDQWWTFNVEYRDEGELRIGEVTVEDTRIDY